MGLVFIMCFHILWNAEFWKTFLGTLYCLYIWALNIIGQPPKPAIDLVNCFLGLSSSASRIMNTELKSNSLWLDKFPSWQSSFLTFFLTYFLLRLCLDHGLVGNFLVIKLKLLGNPSSNISMKRNRIAH